MLVSLGHIGKCALPRQVCWSSSLHSGLLLPAPSASLLEMKGKRLEKTYLITQAMELKPSASLCVGIFQELDYNLAKIILPIMRNVFGPRRPSVGTIHADAAKEAPSWQLATGIMVAVLLGTAANKGKGGNLTGSQPFRHKMHGESDVSLTCPEAAFGGSCDVTDLTSL